LFIGIDDRARLADAYTTNTRRDLKPGGRVWFVGAGGPMGQMHLQRAVMLPTPPKTIIVSDNHTERLDRIQARFGALMEARGIEMILVNPKTGGAPNQLGPYDDIVSMVPSAAVITDSISALAEDGVYNIFAGLAKGTLAELDLGAILAKNQRIVGTSGSSIADLKHTLELVETDALSTNSSLAAIGGLDAFRDGLAGVKAGLFPGKTVIFPHLEGLPLLSLDEIKSELPAVYAKMQDGLFWTNEAEEELFREHLNA
jgi:threonine dehydrogenase-like Zn-dependent dehydrogenase